MELALFTPGAYIWPLHRNFEGFIAALGEPVADCADIASSPHYPARHFTETGFSGMSERTSQRLVELHRDLYSALLRPSEYYARMDETLPELFWPDLAPTPVGGLLDAFYFYFTGVPAAGLSAVEALNVIRSAFFNHEAALPELWLSHTLNNLTPLRRARQEITVSWTVHGGARLRDLAFALITAQGRSHLGVAWLTGRLRRERDGHLQAVVQAGVEPGLASAPERLAAVQGPLECEVQQAVAQVFGWTAAEVVR